MNVYIFILFAATFFSALSQLLLKRSAMREHRSWIFEYLNWRVILAYLIAFLVLFANTYAYTHVEMKYGPVIDTFTYVFVMILSFLVLKERVTKGQLIGNIIIITGIVVYTM